jgi:hypothetical protein
MPSTCLTRASTSVENASPVTWVIVASTKLEAARMLAWNDRIMAGKTRFIPNNTKTPNITARVVKIVRSLRPAK